MKNLTLSCVQCFQHAEDHFRRGSHEVGVALYIQAEKLLPDVADPVMYLALYSRADRIAFKYLLPRV